MRALISVSDKSGVENFAKELVSLGYEIISTGGTYNKLKDAGIAVIEANEVTKFPECFEGRVKTLNPFIHGGILHRRDKQSHLDNAGTISHTLWLLVPHKYNLSMVHPLPH